MGEFVLTCPSQPLTGEQCADGQGEWVSSYAVVYQQVRDVLFQPPPMADVGIAMGVATTLAILLHLPLVVRRILGVVERAGGI